MNRLKQAREYVGFTTDEVAAFMGWLPEWVERAETQDVHLREGDCVRLSGLFKRPVEWLQGAPESVLEISPDLDALLSREGLTTHDRAEVLDFAKFLQHSGKPH